MANKPIVVVGDYCEDTYIFARRLRKHHLSEPETPIEKYPFESVPRTTLVPALAEYIAERQNVYVYYDKTKPYGKYHAKHVLGVAPEAKRQIHMVYKSGLSIGSWSR